MFKGGKKEKKRKKGKEKERKKAVTLATFGRKIASSKNESNCQRVRGRAGMNASRLSAAIDRQYPPPHSDASSLDGVSVVEQK